MSTERLRGAGATGGGAVGVPGRALALGALFAGRFRLLEVLGSGAFSVVYRATDETFHLEVAVKVLSSDAWREENEERARREVEVSRRLQHPNLVRVFEAGEAEGRRFLVLELCQGGTLRRRMARQGPLPPENALTIAEQMLRALGALHEEGVVHRDVKPENCFFAGDGTLKLGDLGLVRAEEWGTLTQTGSTMGTPKYMAPEVIRAESKAGPLSDLYSLGVVLFEMLAGAPPFDGASSAEVLTKQLETLPPLKKIKEKGTPAWLVRFVGRLLEKDARDRFPSAQEALKALQRRSCRRSLTRKGNIRAAAVAGFVLLAGAGAGARWWINREAPLTPAYHDKVLEVKDRSGHVLWTKRYPRLVQSAHYGHFGPGGSPAVACAVVWGEGVTKELKNTAFNTEANTIYMYTRSGEPLGAQGITLDYGRYSPRYLIELSSRAFTPREPERLVAHVIHELWFPQALCLSSFSSGGGKSLPRAVQQIIVYNSGGISNWLYRDLDGDGRKELVYTGTNNRLYRAFFLAAARTKAPGPGESPEVVSPDVERGPDSNPLFYRCFAMDPGNNPPHLAEMAAGRRLSVQFVDGAIISFSDDGQPIQSNSLTPPNPRRVEEYNAVLRRLCALRDRAQWPDLLETVTGLPTEGAVPYAWLSRLFSAHALEGLGRYQEVPGTLRRGISSPECPGTPSYYYQFLLDSAFLGRDYAGCLQRSRAVPSRCWHYKPEIGIMVLWAAVYGGTPAEAERLLTSQIADLYGYVSQEFPGVQAYLAGDFASAEARLRGLKVETLSASDPGLWLVECLIRQGKTGEARQLLDSLNRAFSAERLLDGEQGLCLRWAEGERTTAFVQLMDALSVTKREQARTEVEVRAVLPLTLAKCAGMHRDLGEDQEAGRLQAEALNLAPKSWRPLLKTLGRTGRPPIRGTVSS